MSGDKPEDFESPLPEDFEEIQSDRRGRKAIMDLDPDVQEIIELRAKKVLPFGSGQKWERLLRRLLKGESAARVDTLAFLLSCRDLEEDEVDDAQGGFSFSAILCPETFIVAAAAAFIGFLLGAVG